MKALTRKALTVFAATIIAAILFTFTALAADADVYGSLCFKANSDEINTVIYTQTAENGDRYLFLPSSADLSKLTLYFDTEAVNNVTLSTSKGSVAVNSGEAFDFTALFDAAANEYAVTVTADGSDSSLVVMKSANIRSMYLVSDDPVLFGRKWVEVTKSNEATGTVSIVSSNGDVDYSGKLTSLKGRGNSTWFVFPKKPYQIKLEKKADLIGGTKTEANKKWVLLANYSDATHIHNSTTFALADLLNMQYTPIYEPVDLFYDGEYRGTYLLTEKTEVGSSRIDIEDTDKEIEKLNSETDAYNNPVVVTKTIASAGETVAKENSAGSFKYIDGLAEPALPDGASHHAYLLEIDFMTREQDGADDYRSELSGFVTNRNQAVVAKNPEYMTKETGAFISSFYQEFEDAVYSADGYNKNTGKYYYEYCDLDSLVKVYLINELAKNYDAFRSSTYFYFPADSDVMYAGPIWDYDICYGISYLNRTVKVSTNPENFFATEKYLVNGLIKIESFRDAVKATLNKENGEFYLAVQKLLGSDGIISQQASDVTASQAMNSKMWKTEDYAIVVMSGAEKNYANSIKFMQWYIAERIDWLSEQTAEWSGDNYTIKTDPTGEPEPDKDKEFVPLIQLIINFFKKIAAFFKNIFGGGKGK